MLQDYQRDLIVIIFSIYLMAEGPKYIIIIKIH